jgi:hypothetical protein
MDITAALVIVLAALLVPTDAYSYIGPGAALTAIGTLLAVVGVIFFAVLGIVWYPVKRLLRFLRPKARGRDSS